MELLKNFAVFEGCDGSGTTTQISILENYLLQHRQSLPPFYITFEPTNSSIGKLIRSGLQKKLILTSKTIALLFAADRCEHVYESGGIAERCNRGELVISDRYLPSSLVYQGITCGEELPELLNRDFPVPELLLFLDIDPETAHKRMAGREQKEIYENLDFQILVRKRYLSLLPYLSAEGVRVETIDASLTQEEVAGEVWKAIENMPILRR
jgi:dTMP kinase